MDEPKTVISVNGGSGVPNASAQCVINVQLATSSVTSAARDRWVARGTAMLSLVEAVVAIRWLFGQRVRLPSMKALCATPTLWCAAGSCRVSKPSSYRPTAPSSKHALSGHCNRLLLVPGAELLQAESSVHTTAPRYPTALRLGSTTIEMG